VSSTNSKHLTTCRQVEMVVRYWLEDNLWKAFTLAGHVGTPARMRTDMDIDKLVQARDEIELLTTTQLPLEYAQASHHTMLAFLFLLPFSLVETLGWAMLPVAFFTNLICLCIDESASDMEAPFGLDDTDVDFDGTLHDTDIQSASIIGVAWGHVEPHFNLFPMTEQRGGLLVSSTSFTRKESCRSQRPSIQRGGTAYALDRRIVPASSSSLRDRVDSPR